METITVFYRPVDGSGKPRGEYFVREATVAPAAAGPAAPPAATSAAPPCPLSLAAQNTIKENVVYLKVTVPVAVTPEMTVQELGTRLSQVFPQAAGAQGGATAWDFSVQNEEYSCEAVVDASKQIKDLPFGGSEKLIAAVAKT